MTPSVDLADRIARARGARALPSVVDLYVIALADLADMVAERLAAEDAWQRASDDIETSSALTRLKYADSALRSAIGRDSERDPQWQARVWDRIKRDQVWWRRLLRWRLW